MKSKIKTTLALLAVLLVLPYFPAKAKESNVKNEKVNSVDTVVIQERTIKLEIEVLETVRRPAELPEPELVVVEKKSVPKSTPASRPEPSVSVVQVDKEYVKKRICEVFGSECRNALIIAEHESGFRTNALSRTNDYGVFQLNCRWQGRRVGGNCKLFYDLETNLKVAKQIYNEQGWRPWSTKIYLR